MGDSRAETAERPRVRDRTFLWLGLGLWVALTLHTLVNPVHHDVLEVAMWANAPWSAGFWKHPPLLPWIFKIANLVLPFGPVLLGLLMALNITVGAWAAWRIACLALGTARAGTALGLYALLPFTGVMALKLNHNAVLISLWPLTALAFLRALERPTPWAGLLLGSLAALAMLAKYYSGLLLLAIFLAALISKDRVRFWTSPAPWVAGLAFSVIMLPHVLWFLDQPRGPVGYAMSSEKGARSRSIVFLVETLALVTPAVIAAWLLRRAGGTPSPMDRGDRERELWVMTLVPYLGTVALTAALSLRGATAWALPVFSLLPTLLAARIAPVRASLAVRLQRVCAGIAATVVLALIIVPIVGLALGNSQLADPRDEVVRAAETAWRTRTDAPIRVVTGETRLVGAAAWGLRDRPLGWPDFDTAKAPWISEDRLPATGMVALCRRSDSHCISQARATIAKAGLAGRMSELAITARRDLLLVKGPPAEFVVVIAPPP